MFSFKLFRKPKVIPTEMKVVEPDIESELNALEERIHAVGGETSVQLRGLATELNAGRGKAAELENIKATLNWAVREMETVCKTLGEVESIGVWSRSDGCSDNRDRRKGLKEASCDCYTARKNLEEVGAMLPREKSLLPIISEIEELGKSLDALAESVSDIMGEDTPFRSDVGKLQDRAEALYDQLLPIAESHRDKFLQIQQRVADLEEKHRSLLVDAAEKPG